MTVKLTDVNGRKWVLVPTDGHWDMTKAAIALIKSTGVNPGNLTVGVLADAIENAIAAAPEFEGSISDRDETIRQLRARLDEYEKAATVAAVMDTSSENRNRELLNGSVVRFTRIPQVGTELIARPTRKDGE